jgi:hypothetical protein
VCPLIDICTLLPGTMDEPAKDITIRGVGFRDAAATFMAPWG